MKTSHPNSRRKKSSSTITHRVNYTATVQNLSDNPLFDVNIFLAFPPSIDPHQELLDIKAIPTIGREASDLAGNHWLHFTYHQVAGHQTFTCGYIVLVQNRTVQFVIPDSPVKSSIPENIASYTRPENFIESHHHLIKDLARDLAIKNRTPKQFVRAAMNAVVKKLTYVPQKHERGAAYAIEQRKGDCTEYAALFTAICRANRIPARIQAGFANNDQKWERHAWSEIWIKGRWIPIDPTWYGQLGFIGITNRHIPVIIGNWLTNRIRQEFTISWRAAKGIQPPKFKTTWKVIRAVGIQS